MAATFSVSESDALSLVYIPDSDEIAVRDCRSGPTNLKALQINNTGASAYFVKLYDSMNPVIGTTDPIFVFRIPATTKRFLILNNGDGHDFAVGLSLATLTTGGTGGTTGPGANEVKLHLFTEDTEEA